MSTPTMAHLTTGRRFASPFAILVFTFFYLTSFAPGVHGQNSPPDAAAYEKLLNRIDQLEKSHDSELQKLVNRIGDLEKQLGTIKAEKVLPEATAGSAEVPTIHDLDQKVRILERKNEQAAEEAEALAKTTPRVSVGANGFTLISPDTNFVLKIRGVVQVDSRTFFDDHPLLRANDGFLLRRVRPVLEGTVYRDFDFLLVPDFGGSSVQVFDALLNYRLMPEIQVRAGKFKGPFGFEQLQADSTLSFNERSMVTGLTPTRNIGLELWGEALDGRLNYAAGVFNGGGDGRNPATSDFSDKKELAGRLFAQPFKNSSWAGLQGFGFGVGGGFGDSTSNSAALPNPTGGTLPGYVTDGQQQFFAYNPKVGTVVADGAHYRILPQLSYTYGPFGLLGEYVASRQSVLNSSSLRHADLNNRAWQISGQWVLTGEPASFSGINPKHPFNLRGGGGWGAWQLVARVGELDIDKAAFQGFSNPLTSASSAAEWSVGINWWLNKNVRFMTSFSHTTFTGGGQVNLKDASTLTSPALVNHQAENVLFTRLQISF